MKNKELTKRKWKLLGEILLAMIGSMLLSLFLIYFIFDGVLNDDIAENMYRINPKIYSFLLKNKSSLISLLFILDGIGCMYLVINRYVQKTDQIIRSIGAIYQGKKEDIVLPTEYAEVAMQLNEMQYKALQNEKIAKEAEARKNDLIVYMAHDLKTPLTSIIGYLSLLEEEKLPASLRKKYQSIAKDKAERLEELINEFFEITRYNVQNLSIEKQQVDFTMLLNQVVDEFYPLGKEKELEFVTDIEPNITLKADGGKLARVMDNLLRNAINYSDPGTQIQIEAKEIEGKVQIRISNKGEKIPAHKLNQIFEKFYRLDSARTTQKRRSRIRSCNCKRNC